MVFSCVSLQDETFVRGVHNQAFLLLTLWEGMVRMKPPVYLGSSSTGLFMARRSWVVDIPPFKDIGKESD